MTVANFRAFMLLLAFGLVAGCSAPGGQPGTDDPFVTGGQDMSEGSGSTVYGGDGEGGISSSNLSESERRAQEQALAEQERIRDLRNITTFYFDFDTAEIKPDARDALIAHARYLVDNPQQRVRLEGHADERGTKEYNLALGERRASAIAKFLVINGVSRDQILTVSYGEEKPVSMGSGENAWAENRRVELLFL